MILKSTTEMNSVYFIQEILYCYCIQKENNLVIISI